MAINFTTDILTVNEDDALNAGTDETTQLAFDTALPAISAYLATQTAGTDGDIQTPEVASQANFVNLAFTGGSSLTALTFASDANGTDFSTTVGVDSGLVTIDGDSILLYAVAGFRTSSSVARAARPVRSRSQLRCKTRRTATTPAGSSTTKRSTTMVTTRSARSISIPSPVKFSCRRTASPPSCSAISRMFRPRIRFSR